MWTVGKHVAMANVHASSAVEFRRSPRRRLVGAVVAMLLLAAVVTAVMVLQHRQWWELARWMPARTDRTP